ncbi:MAG: hypothetical protein H3C62_09435 [Gemmatimonadaceae bacterium]|nr:hypothetical protein [Gemmatimonadaceae bacterium]
MTAKLPKRFCDRRGAPCADELEGRFHAVHATHRNDLRELNELYFARCDLLLEQRLAELDAKWERRFGEFATCLERRVGDQTRRMFAVWAAQLIPIIGLWFRG